MAVMGRFAAVYASAKNSSRVVRPSVSIYFAWCDFHGRPQAWARGQVPPRNVVKCFCALVAIAKRSVDELFMHYFHNIVGFWGLRCIDLVTGAPSLNPGGRLSSPDR